MKHLFFSLLLFVGVCFFTNAQSIDFTYDKTTKGSATELMPFRHEAGNCSIEGNTYIEALGQTTLSINIESTKVGIYTYTANEENPFLLGKTGINLMSSEMEMATIKGTITISKSENNVISGTFEATGMGGQILKGTFKDIKLEE